MAVRVRPSRKGSSDLRGPLMALTLLAALWLSYGGALTDGASGGGGPDGTVIAATVARQGDRGRLTVSGRLRESRSEAPVTVRVLGNTNTAGPCPHPTVARATAVTGGGGSVRVGWRAVSGGRPGWALERGRRFAMSGTVRLPSTDALRLCVHLVRGGARPTVLRTTEVVAADAFGRTPLWAQVRPFVVGHVVPVARVVVAILLAGIVLRLAVRARRRRRARGGWPRMIPVPPDSAAPGPAEGDGAPADPPSDGAPEGAPPGGAGRGGTVTPPSRGADAAGRSARTQAQRRADRWRARRKREAEAAGLPYNPNEPLPRHIAVWDIGADGEELAAERFAENAPEFPSVSLLHDRRESRRARANIDHVLVGPAGVVVADTKHWARTVRVERGRLMVRGRDRTGAIDGVLGQVEKVRKVLAAGGHGAVAVSGVLHWTRCDGVLLDGSLVVRGVPLLDAPNTMRRASEPAILDDVAVRRVSRCLEEGLPRAR